MRGKFLLVLFVLCLGIFYCVDYKNDMMVDESANLLNAIKSRGYLIVGVKSDTRPFGFIENGINRGYDIDIARSIAKSIFKDDNKIRFVTVTPANRLFKLNAGEVDMVVATMTITPERQNKVYFSVPYFVSRQALLVKKGSNINSLVSLGGKNIGVLCGSTGEDNIHRLLPTANVMLYNNYDEAYIALKSDTVLAVFTGDFLLKHYIDIDPSVTLLPTKYAKEYYAVAVRKNEAAEGLLDVINENLKSMEDKGELEKLRHKWDLN